MRQRKVIQTDATIIERIAEGDSQYEYVVSQASHAIIMLSALNLHNASARVRVRLSDKNSSADIVGIVVGSGKSSFALHTMQAHEAPETTSNLLVKTVLAQQATSAYDGGIRVEKAAQKTNAYQRNENLVLSDQAHAQSKPALEILADDVRCTHGATVGPVRQEELWYLASRGIDPSQGERLIVEGFLYSALEKLREGKAKDALWKEIQSAL